MHQENRYKCIKYEAQGERFKAIQIVNIKLAEENCHLQYSWNAGC